MLIFSGDISATSILSFVLIQGPRAPRNPGWISLLQHLEYRFMSGSSPSGFTIQPYCLALWSCFNTGEQNSAPTLEAAEASGVGRGGSIYTPPSIHRRLLLPPIHPAHPLPQNPSCSPPPPETSPFSSLAPFLPSCAVTWLSRKGGRKTSKVQGRGMGMVHSNELPHTIPPF